MTGTWVYEKGNEEFKVHREGQNVRITLTRPRKGNTLTTGLIEALTAFYKDVAVDRRALRVLLTAEGKYFCAGMDLNARGGVLDKDQEAKQHQWDLLQTLFESIDKCPKATLALINGPAFGAGCGLAFACDIRITTQKTTFNISEAKVGLAPAVIMKWVFREWGIGRSREAMLTARPVDGKDLLLAGIVHTVVPGAADLQLAAQKYIAYLEECGPQALAAIKGVCRAQENERDRDIKMVYDKMMRPTPESRHGVESFHAKRSPDWATFYSDKISKM